MFSKHFSSLIRRIVLPGNQIEGRGHDGPTHHNRLLNQRMETHDQTKPVQPSRFAVPNYIISHLRYKKNEEKGRHFLSVFQLILI